MVCFEVLINRKKVCLAGVGDSGVLTAVISWVADPPGSPPKRARKKSDEASLHVGGLYEPAGNVHVHPRWAQRKIRPGDEVIVRIIESGKPDRARHKTVQTEEEMLEQQRRYYLHMKEQFENAESRAPTKRRGQKRRAP